MTYRSSQLRQCSFRDYSYSCKWRFKFNASKSCVLTFFDKCNNRKSEFTWHLGQTEVPQKESYNHLGITVHSKCKLSVAISDACKKGKKSYFALSDIGSKYLNPATVSHLYKCIVLPSVLYGCETMQIRYIGVTL